MCINKSNLIKQKIALERELISKLNLTDFSQIVIWGTEISGTFIFNLLKNNKSFFLENNSEIVSFCDTFAHLKDKQNINDTKIFSPAECFEKFPNALYLIASHSFEKIVESIRLYQPINHRIKFTNALKYIGFEYFEISSSGKILAFNKNKKIELDDFHSFVCEYDSNKCLNFEFHFKRINWLIENLEENKIRAPINIFIY